MLLVVTVRSNTHRSVASNCAALVVTVRSNTHRSVASNCAALVVTVLSNTHRSVASNLHCSYNDPKSSFSFLVFCPFLVKYLKTRIICYLSLNQNNVEIKGRLPVTLIMYSYIYIFLQGGPLFKICLLYFHPPLSLTYWR